MKKAIQYLITVFSGKIKLNETNYDILPLYMKDRYVLRAVSLLNSNYVLVQHKEAVAIEIKTLLKERAQILKLTNRQPIFVFNNLRLNQRNALIQNDILFVVPDKQIYIPKTLIDLTEEDTIAKHYPEKFIKSTQIIFTYLLLNSVEGINAHRLADQVHCSVTTANKALNELADRGILNKEGNRTRTKYLLTDKLLAWNTGKKYLYNPVSCVHTHTKNQIDMGSSLLYKSYDTALYTLSDQFDENTDSAVYYACVSGNYNQVYNGKPPMTDRYDMDNYVHLQCLAYDPGLFTQTDTIDVITLYAQYSNNPILDERTQIALDKMIEEALNG